MCLPDFYAFLCDVLGVISLTILAKMFFFCGKHQHFMIKRAKIWSPSVKIPG